MTRAKAVELFRYIGTGWTRRIVLTASVFTDVGIRRLVNEGKIKEADVRKIRTHKGALKWLKANGYINHRGQTSTQNEAAIKAYWSFSDKERSEILKEAKRSARGQPARIVHPGSVGPSYAPARVTPSPLRTPRPPAGARQFQPESISIRELRNKSREELLERRRYLDGRIDSIRNDINRGHIQRRAIPTFEEMLRKHREERIKINDLLSITEPHTPPVKPRRVPTRIIGRGEFPSSVYLRFVGGRSDKFYEISHRGNLVYLRWGRFGTEGTRRTKEFGSFKEALKFHNKQIKSKLRKGYWME